MGPQLISITVTGDKMLFTSNTTTSEMMKCFILYSGKPKPDFGHLVVSTYSCYIENILSENINNITLK